MMLKYRNEKVHVYLILLVISWFPLVIFQGSKEKNELGIKEEFNRLDSVFTKRILLDVFDIIDDVKYFGAEEKPMVLDVLFDKLDEDEVQELDKTLSILHQEGMNRVLDKKEVRFNRLKFLLLSSAAQLAKRKREILVAIDYLEGASHFENGFDLKIDLGNNYTLLQDNKLALEYYEEALQMSDLSERQVFYAKYHLARSLSLVNPSRSLSILKELRYRNVYNEPLWDLRVLTYLTMDYLYTNDTLNAKAVLRDAIQIGESEQMKKAYPNILMILSDLLIAESDIDSARVVLEKALSIEKSLQNNANSYRTYERLLEVCKIQQDTIRAAEIIGPYLAAQELKNVAEEQNAVLIRAYENRNQEFTSWMKLEKLVKNLWFWISLTFLIAFSVFLSRYKKKGNNQIEYLKEGSVGSDVKSLNSENQIDVINEILNKELNDTDQKVLACIIKDHTVSINELAESVFLSKDGVKTSLRRLYNVFEINSDRNKKVLMAQKVQQILLDYQSNDS